MEISQDNNSKLPIDCKKPNFTIQDSYLMFYFGRINMPKPQNNSSLNDNPKSLIKSFEKEVLFSNYKKSEINSITKQSDGEQINSSERQEGEMNLISKFSGKKSKRQNESFDPLEILNTRDKKGNFVKNERKNILHIENKDRSSVNDQLLETGLDSNLNNEKIDVEENNPNHLQNEEVDNNFIEEDLLIPASLRYKKKNK
jgi:hypothetical protein